MPWDNLGVRQVQAELEAKYETGIDDGMQFAGYPMPAWWEKPVKLLTVYERGWLFGYWLTQWLGSSK